ncbi:hypothetical protein F-liban_341 [Faustovirus]|nr:hypothetical protein F-liban_341 [Faustovirus]SME65028.1 Hypothetical protein FSTVST1_331 [Faustovirus ST1]
MGERCCVVNTTHHEYKHLSDLLGNILLGFSTLNTGFMTVLQVVNQSELKKLTHPMSNDAMFKFIKWQRGQTSAQGFLFGALWVMAPAGVIAKLYAHNTR